MSIARRVELRVVAIGGALPEDLTDRLLSATYTDNEEDAADDFQLSYDNAVNSGNSQWVEVKTTIAPPETGKLVQREIAQTETIDYIVQRGDTLSGIAAKYLGSASKYTQIVQENGIKNPDLIYPGQVFKITTGGEATSTPTEAVQATQAAGVQIPRVEPETPPAAAETAREAARRPRPLKWCRYSLHNWTGRVADVPAC